MTTNYSNKERRELKGIQQVVLKDLGKLTIRQGNEESLLIEADEEMLPHIQSILVNGVLELGISRRWTERVANSFTLRHIGYQLTVRDLDRIELSGISNLDLRGFTTHQLELVTRGHIRVKLEDLHLKKLVGRFYWSSRLELSGEIDEQVIEMSGTSRLEASDVVSQTGSYELGDSSQATVRVEKKIDLRAKNQSVFQYFGAAKVKADLQDQAVVEPLV
ncbi:MAG: DUF2807 domain-containing protein [Anaerolineaceae bacterium]|nr:DUF2807 domain-containing protein [Anaerolineaceae bacterium]